MNLKAWQDCQPDTESHYCNEIGFSLCAAANDVQTECVVQAALLSQESRASLRKAYMSSEPYMHCVFADPFDPATLRRVRDEIINNIQVFDVVVCCNESLLCFLHNISSSLFLMHQATYKETDLFKVFQTG
jgi:hypothetical protein